MTIETTDHLNDRTSCDHLNTRLDHYSNPQDKTKFIQKSIFRVTDDYSALIRHRRVWRHFFCERQNLQVFMTS